MWPDQKHYPNNRTRVTVKAELRSWLFSSSKSLVIAGYASLGQLIELIDSQNNSGNLRILLGDEPFDYQRKIITRPVQEEARDYWLRKGLSIEQCPYISKALRLIESGNVKFRFPNNESGHICDSVHAKIYCSQKAALIGSSNFTAAGLTGRIEGNVVFYKSEEPKKFSETWGLAESIWQLGTDANDFIIGLLQQLLQFVTWQEALARSCIELLEGRWVNELLSQQINTNELWPSQQDGIAQALWVIDRMGCVLIGDAAGSGKTRQGAYLIQALVAKLVSQGQLTHLCTILCPPAVVNNWENETTFPGPQITVKSLGLLKTKTKKSNQIQIDKLLKNSNILVLDEAHNYHNLKTNRSQKLLDNLAQYLILLTATPINRSSRDLLPLLNILGADNLSDRGFKVLSKLINRRYVIDINDTELEELRKEIRQFTVRRTIPQFKRYIERHPDKYKSKLGINCSYPEVENITYTMNESDYDRSIAKEIKSCAKQLRGLNYLLKPIKEDDTASMFGSIHQYVQNRCNAAKALTQYLIMDALRASKFVLIGSLSGDSEASTLAGVTQDHSKKINLGLITKFSNPIKFPVPDLPLDLLPEFLRTKESFDKAIIEELEIFRKIRELTNLISDNRDKEKAQHIATLSKSHSKLIVFEHRILPLKIMQKRLSTLIKHKIHYAVGNNQAGKDSAIEAFALDSIKGDHIALCSDAMSEGVNFQSSSVLIMLNIPSVIRYAEQRIGRIERLDSPHKSVEIHWPKDADEFKLEIDKKFIRRIKEAEALIGSNISLPKELFEIDECSNNAEIAIKHLSKLRKEQQENLSIDDAFYSVRNLFDGDNPLIPQSTLDSMRGVTSLVISRVSVIHSMTYSWGFFCFAGDQNQTPSWGVVTENNDVIVSLDDITKFLRENLNNSVVSLPPNRYPTQKILSLTQMIPDLQLAKISKNQNAVLLLLDQYLKYEQQQYKEDRNQDRVDELQLLIDHLPNQSRDLFSGVDIPNFHVLKALSNEFAKIIAPIRAEKLKLYGSKKLIRYQDLLPDLKRERIRYETIHDRLCSKLNLIDHPPKIAAAIFGISRLH